jgi:hypothetical protein
MAISEPLSLLICFLHDAVKPAPFTPSNRLKPQRSRRAVAKAILLRIQGTRTR